MTRIEMKILKYFNFILRLFIKINVNQLQDS